MLLRLALTIILAGSFARAALADAFSLSLHANGGADTTLYRGEPLLVQALLILAPATVDALQPGDYRLDPGGRSKPIFEE